MGGSSNGEKHLLIGWASADITPERPVQLHGQFHERISKYVRDPLTATALALETASGDGPAEQAIMISCDLVNVPRLIVEQLRTLVGSRLPDFDARKLFLNATHTHTGPALMQEFYPPPPPGVMKPSEYTAFFLERAAAAIAQAWDRRRPGGMSRALGHAAIGFNRRVVYDDGSSRMYGTSDTPRFRSVEGSQDHGIEMLFCWDEQDALTGMVLNVACPSQVVEGQYYVSADFWAAARTHLRKVFHEGLFVYPMTGSAGDQSPRDLVRRGRGEPDMRDESGLEEKGRRISKAVEYAYETAQTGIRREFVFRHHVEELDLPSRKVTQDEAGAARQAEEDLLKQGPIDVNSNAGMRLRRHRHLLDRYERQGNDPRYSMDLHVLRLGDVAIATNPFELYLDYGLRMKAQSVADQTLVVQLTCDRGIYLPTAKAIAGGHYGAMVSDNIVGPEGGEVLVERTVELINGMWDEKGE